MHIDLHTHTTASDGVFSPRELIARARQRGVSVLSITDHDSVAAYDELDGTETGVTLIPGLEWSTRWRRSEIHVLGLGLCPDDAELRRALEQQQAARRDRAARIAAKLEKLGVEQPLDGARRQAGEHIIGRPHFARHMVDTGFVRDESRAFSKYLAAGKPAWCGTEWAGLEQVIAWTHAAGGLAVLAHPAAYKLTRTKLGELIDDFCAAGGDGMEVVSGKQTQEVTTNLVNLCRRTGLMASCGSDFHRSGPGMAEPGECDLPVSACRPVWAGWPAAAGT